MRSRAKAVAAEVNEMDSPFIEVRIVERPATRGRQQWYVDPEVKKIVETVVTGKAVLLAARSPESMRRIQMAVRHQVKALGFKMTYRKAGSGRIVAWAEKVGPSKP